MIAPESPRSPHRVSKVFRHCGASAIRCECPTLVTTSSALMIAISSRNRFLSTPSLVLDAIILHRRTLMKARMYSCAIETLCNIDTTLQQLSALLQVSSMYRGPSVRGVSDNDKKACPSFLVDSCRSHTIVLPGTC